MHAYNEHTSHFSYIYGYFLFAFYFFEVELHNTTKNAIMSANAGSILIVFGFSMAVAIKFGLNTE